MSCARFFYRIDNWRPRAFALLSKPEYEEREMLYGHLLPCPASRDQKGVLSTLVGSSFHKQEHFLLYCFLRACDGSALSQWTFYSGLLASPYGNCFRHDQGEQRVHRSKRDVLLTNRSWCHKEGKLSFQRSIWASIL